MKTYPYSNHQRCFAFTLLELMIVAAALAAVVLALLPALAKPRCGGNQRANCVNNLKQVGLSFRLWASDNGENYPMQLSITNGGTMELVADGIVYRHFSVMSNELATPKILNCRSDGKRSQATNFSSMRDTNISYFVGLNATSADPQTWLAGDRNITNASVAVRGVLTVPKNTPIGWTEKMHMGAGNVCLADGSVQQLSSSKLNESLRYQTNSPLRLAMPE